MNNDINYLYLRDHKIFDGLSKEELYTVLAYARFSRKKRSEIIITSDRGEDNNCYFIIKGKVKLSEMNTEGHSLIKSIEREGDFFGKIDKQRKSGYAYAQVLSEELVYFYLSCEALEKIVLEVPRLALSLLNATRDKLAFSDSKYKELVFDDVKTRLLSFFKKWAVAEGVRFGDTVVIKNYLTHNDIAEIISTCRQTVTAILNSLKAEGYLTYTRKEIIIKNVSTLESAA